MKKLYNSLSQRQLPGASWGLPEAYGPQATDSSSLVRPHLAAFQLHWSSALYFSTKALWEKAGLRRSPQMLCMPPLSQPGLIFWTKS